MIKFWNFIISLFLMGSFFGPLQGQTAGEVDAEDNTLITVHAEDAFLPSILAILAKESGYNIVTDPNVNKQDKVSIHLDEVPIEQAINLVVRAVGLSYEVVGNSFLIADPKKLKEEPIGALVGHAFLFVPLDLPIDLNRGNTPTRQPGRKLGGIIRPHQSVTGLLVLFQTPPLPRPFVHPFPALLLATLKIKNRPLVPCGLLEPKLTQGGQLALLFP